MTEIDEGLEFERHCLAHRMDFLIKLTTHPGMSRKLAFEQYRISYGLYFLLIHLDVTGESSDSPEPVKTTCGNERTEQRDFV